MYLYLDCKSILIVLIQFLLTIFNQMVADIPIEEATGQEWDLVVCRNYMNHMSCHYKILKILLSFFFIY